MPAVARIGDSFTDGDTVKSGSGSVFANGMPVARLGDSTMGHSCWPPVPIISASGSVFANGVPVARLGDAHSVHCCPNNGCHGGNVAVGSGNVFVG